MRMHTLLAVGWVLATLVVGSSARALEAGEVWSSGFVPDVANYFQLTGPLVAAPGGSYFTAKGDLHGSLSPPALSIAPGLGAPGNVTGLDHEGGVTVIAAQPGDGAPVAGVWYASTGGFVPIT